MANSLKDVDSIVKSTDALVKKIHSLTSAGNDGDALCLIDLVLESCHDETFLANCVQWMQLCCKTGRKNDDCINKKLDLFVRLIKLSTTFPELVRPISHNIAPRFSDFFFKRFSENRKGWEAMAELMSAYGASLIHCKEMLESFMASSLESQRSLPLHLSRCWALLPSIGGGGIKGAVYKANWSNQISRLIGTSHQILNVLFKDVAEFEAYNSAEDSAFEIARDPSYEDLANLLSNTCSTMRCMLLGYFPVAKNVPVGKIMALVNRVISVSSMNLGNSQIGRIMSLQETLPTVVISSLSVLTAMIVSVGRALLPIANQVTRTLMQAVQVSDEWPQIRLFVYASLRNWITVSGCACGLQAWPKQIILSLLKDFEPVQMMVKLKSKGVNAKESKGRLQMVPSDTDERIRYASVDTFSLLVTEVGPKLTPLIHKLIQSTVIREICQQVKERKMSINCRVAFYSLLRQLCLEPCPQWPPPTQFALHLFRIGVRDPSPIVATACSVSISALQRIIHPEFSVAAFPVDRCEIERNLQKEITSTNEELCEIEHNLQKERTSTNEELCEIEHNLQKERTSTNEELCEIEHDLQKERTSTNGDLSKEVQPRKRKTITKTSSPWQAKVSKSGSQEALKTTEEEICDSPPPSKNNERLDACRVKIPQLESPVAAIETSTPASKRQKLNEDCAEPEALLLSNNGPTVKDPANEGVTFFILPRDQSELQDKPKVESTVPIPSENVTAPAVPECSTAGDKTGQTSKTAELPKKDGKRGRRRNSVLEDIDVYSPMSLRSGTVVSSPSSHSSSDFRQRARHRDDSSSVDNDSRSMQSSPSSGLVDPDAIMELFDDTLHPCLQ